MHYCDLAIPSTYFASVRFRLHLKKSTRACSNIPPEKYASARAKYPSQSVSEGFARISFSSISIAFSASSNAGYIRASAVRIFER